VLPTIEELQTAWEAKCDKPVFAKYHDAINDGLEKINTVGSESIAMFGNFGLFAVWCYTV
jgi:hypothetical protein